MGVFPRVLSPSIPSSSSFTVLASFSASSLSFFSSSRECFSSALAPAPILGPAALRLTRSLEVSTRMGSELQPRAASRTSLPVPTTTSHQCWPRTGPRSPGATWLVLLSAPRLKPGAPPSPSPDKAPSICSRLSSAIPGSWCQRFCPRGHKAARPQLCPHPVARAVIQPPLGMWDPHPAPALLWGWSWGGSDGNWQWVERFPLSQLMLVIP